MWISRKEYEGLQTDSIRRIELEKEVERLSGLVPTHSECVLTKEEYDDLINDRKLKQRLEDEVDRLAKLITANEKLTEEELRHCAWGEVGTYVAEIEEGSGRWTQPMSTIFEIEGQLYCIDWQRGLTEYQ